MFRNHTSIVVALLVSGAFTAACGGEPPAPKAPETEPVATAAPAADMPAPPATLAAQIGEAITLGRSPVGRFRSAMPPARPKQRGALFT